MPFLKKAGKGTSRHLNIQASQYFCVLKLTDMKFSSILTLAALSAASMFYACGNEDSSSKLTGEGADASSAITPPPTDPTKAEPPQNAEGVWHYTCPKGCSGGGGSAAPCSQCGTTLAHNQAYHAGGGADAAPAITTTPITTGDPASPTITMPNVGKNEPPQNAAGVWHYTCPSGCAGGGGSAMACATCGKTLEHNKAYHQ